VAARVFRRRRGQWCSQCRVSVAFGMAARPERTAAIQLSAPRQRRPIGQGHAGVQPVPPAARVQPKAGLIRPLLVKSDQTRLLNGVIRSTV
jgi:hypothetical protein